MKMILIMSKINKEVNYDPLALLMYPNYIQVAEWLWFVCADCLLMAVNYGDVLLFLLHEITVTAVIIVTGLVLLTSLIAETNEFVLTKVCYLFYCRKADCWCCRRGHHQLIQFVQLRKACDLRSHMKVFEFRAQFKFVMFRHQHNLRFNFTRSVNGLYIEADFLELFFRKFLSCRQELLPVRCFSKFQIFQGIIVTSVMP